MASQTPGKKLKVHRYIREYLRRLRVLAWNEQEQRLRPFLRVYVFLLLYLVIFALIPILVAPSGDNLFRSAMLRVLLVCSMAVLIFGAAIYLDKRPVHTFGLKIDRDWVTDAVVGFAIGGAIPTVAAGVIFVSGWLAIGELGYTPTIAFHRDIGLAIIISVSIAVVEELVFRGYVLTNALEGFDLHWLSQPVTIATAWGVSALLFAVSHPAPTLINGFHFLSSGLLLGLAYLLSGQIGLPIGIHAGFNFVSTYVFSTAGDPSVAVLSLTAHGPSWLVSQTGLVQTVLQLPAAVAIFGYIWWRTGRIKINSTIK